MLLPWGKAVSLRLPLRPFLSARFYPIVPPASRRAVPPPACRPYAAAAPFCRSPPCPAPQAARTLKNPPFAQKSRRLLRVSSQKSSAFQKRFRLPVGELHSRRVLYRAPCALSSGPLFCIFLPLMVQSGYSLFYRGVYDPFFPFSDFAARCAAPPGCLRWRGHAFLLLLRRRAGFPRRLP